MITARVAWLALPLLIGVGACAGPQPLYAPESYPLRDQYLSCALQKARELATSTEPADIVVVAAQAGCAREEQAAAAAMARSAAVRLSEAEVAGSLRRGSYRQLLAEVVEIRQKRGPAR